MKFTPALRVAMKLVIANSTIGQGNEARCRLSPNGCYPLKRGKVEHGFHCAVHGLQAALLEDEDEMDRRAK